MSKYFPLDNDVVEVRKPKTAIEPLIIKEEKRLRTNWDEKVIIITFISSIVSAIVSTLITYSLLK
jgi:hypothetical protein